MGFFFKNFKCFTLFFFFYGFWTNVFVIITLLPYTRKACSSFASMSWCLQVFFLAFSFMTSEYDMPQVYTCWDWSCLVFSDFPNSDTKLAIFSAVTTQIFVVPFSFFILLIFLLLCVTLFISTLWEALVHLQNSFLSLRLGKFYWLVIKLIDFFSWVMSLLLMDPS